MNVKDLVETLTYGGFWKMAGKYWKAGFGEMHRSLSKKAFLTALQQLMPEVQLKNLIPGGAGVRAQAMHPSGAMVDDFYIQQAPRMVHVLNAPSPAATASIAIGRYIAPLAARTLGLEGRRSATGLEFGWT